MKDTDQMRYMRWGIPGWVMFLSYFGFMTIDIIFSPQSGQNELFIALSGLVHDTSITSSMSAAVIGLLIAAAGIPFGFLIYQIYFYIRWNSPFSRDGFFPPLVVGRWDDLERTLEGISDKQIRNGEEWRDEWVTKPLYKKDHGHKWRYVENFYIEISEHYAKESSGSSLYARYRYLLDLLHILGAATFGIYLGYFGYLMTKVKMQTFSLTVMLIACVFIGFPLVYLLDAEDKLKRGFRANEAKESLVGRLFEKYPLIQHFNLSAIFLFACGAFLYLGSPSPYNIIYTNEHFALRCSVVILLIVVLFYSRYRSTKDKQVKTAIIYELLLLIGFTLIAGLISQATWNYFTPNSWSFGWATYAFLIATMVFTKNRQNTRDDLIFTQNFTIKRYLHSPHLTKVEQEEK